MIKIRVKNVSWRKLAYYFGITCGIVLLADQIRRAFIAVNERYVEIPQGESITYLAASFGAGLLLIFFQILAWTAIMRCMGVSISLEQAVQGYLLSFLPRYIPGGVWGYWSRSHWLENVLGVPYRVSMLGSLLEAASLILTSLGIISVSIGVIFPSWQLGLLRASGFVSMALVASFVCLISSRRFSAGTAISQNKRLFNGIIAVLAHFALWLAYGGSIFLLSKAIIPLSVIDYWSHVIAISAAWLVGFVVIFIPAGIGLREKALYTLLVFFGFSPWQSSVVAIISRIECMLCEVFWIIIGITLVTTRLKNNPLGVLQLRANSWYHKANSKSQEGQDVTLYNH